MELILTTRIILTVVSHGAISEKVFLRLPGFWVGRVLDLDHHLGVCQAHARKPWLLGNSLQPILRLDFQRPHCCGYSGKYIVFKFVLGDKY